MYFGLKNPRRVWRVIDVLYCFRFSRKLVKLLSLTRCQILRLKCTKFDFGWGSAPDATGGAYSAPLDPLAGF